MPKRWINLVKDRAQESNREVGPARLDHVFDAVRVELGEGEAPGVGGPAAGASGLGLRGWKQDQHLPEPRRLTTGTQCSWLG